MLTAVFAIVVRYWHVCAISAVIAAAVAYGIASSLTPIYRVELTLAPASDAPGQGGSVLAGLGGLVAAAGLGVNQGQLKTQAMALLRSRTFVAEYITQGRLLPLLYPESFAADGRPLVDRDVPTLNQAVTHFIDSIMFVTEDPRTGLVTLRLDFSDPVVGLKWARDLVARVNEVARARDIAEAEESMRYLDGELQKTAQVSVRDAIGRVLEEQLQRSTMANARREYAFKTIEPGMIPDRPVRPRKVRMVLAAFLLGGILTAFLLCARAGVFAPVQRE